MQTTKVAYLLFPAIRNQRKVISSAGSQNKLKAANKQKLLFTSLSDKLLFQQAAAVPNRTVLMWVWIPAGFVPGGYGYG